MLKRFIAVLLMLALGVQAEALSVNSRGQVAMGAGGLPGSVDGQLIPNAFGPCWVTDDVIAYPSSRVPSIQTQDLRNGSVTQVAPRGANDLACGGGVWAAWLAGFGLFSSTGLHLPNAGLIGVGPGGEIAYVPDRQSGIGVNVREQNGSEWRLSDGIVFDLQLLGGQRAIWTFNQQVLVKGIPQPQLAASKVWRPRVASPNGELWITYFTEQFGVISHPFTDASRGFVVSGPGVDLFQHDTVALGPVLRAVGAARAGELPEDLRVKNFNVTTEPRVAFSGSNPPPPPPPPAEVCGDKVDNDGDGLVDEDCSVNPPPPPPVECGEVPAQGQELLHKLWARPDVNALVRSSDDEDRRTSARMFAEQLAFSIGPEWGTKRADPGRPQSKDAVAKIVGGVLCGWDIVNGTTRELNFGHGEQIPGQVFISVTPKNHLEGDTQPPPPPPPPDDIEKLRARVVELERLLADARHIAANFEEHMNMFWKLADERKALLDKQQMEIEILKNQLADPCSLVAIEGPGWIRSLFGIRCRPLQ